MKYLKRFLLFVLVLIVLVLIIAIFLPSKLHLEESSVINTPAELIFKQVNNLKNWEQWSPFQKEDTAMTSVYEGPEAGVGAVQKWKSKVNGDGTMTITESIKDSLIRMQLDFMEHGKTTSDWKFEKQGMSTKVTWSIDIENMGYPMGRIFGLFMPKMMHKAFKDGLENLKKLSEAQHAKLMVYKTGEITVKENAAWQALAVKDSSTCDKISDVMAAAYAEIGKYCGENKIECIGPPYAKYFMWNDTINKFVMEAGFPVKLKTPVKGKVYSVEYPKMRVVTAMHTGSYETAYYTYMAIEKYIKDNKLKQKGAPWEVYISDPEKEPDVSKLQTEIFYPVE